MTINHQEILSMLESHDPNKELSAGIQRRQDLIRKIMAEQNPDQTKDLITIAQDFKGLMNLDENELSNRYNIVKIEELKQQYPDFEFELYQDGNIEATLINYEGKTLSGLPSGLESLDIWGCPNLEVLPEFPSNLERLRIESCPNLEALPELPSGLESLEVWTCPNLEALPAFPTGLEKLGISSCHNLEALPVLPIGLTELLIRECSNLETLPELPIGLKRLDVGDCSNFEGVPEIPPGLVKLAIWECPNLTQVTRDRIEEFNNKKS